MPEILLCCDCKQSINKGRDDYVVIKKATDSYPEVLAHVACEQKRGASGGRFSMILLKAFGAGLEEHKLGAQREKTNSLL